MPADLTLPGIPGLLRRGSPVVVVSLCDETTDCDGWRLAVGDHGTVTDGPTSYVVVAGTTVSGEGPPWSELPVGCVALDLTDATGRAHAAWWLAGREFPSARHEEARFFSTGNGWWLTCGHALHPVGWTNTDLDLDRAADPRLLPDGSRWVDAEALRLVVLHVAGVAP